MQTSIDIFRGFRGLLATVFKKLYCLSPMSPYPANSI